MFHKRPSSERGHVQMGWLDSYHSFSFGRYYDPAQMGFRSLRVINDDIIHGGGGFPEHGHADMEILTYVTEGALLHGDSMGHHQTLRPGDIQLMRAGSGIRHSEFNASANEAAKLLQIWISPAEKGLTPGYWDRHVSALAKKDQLALLVSPDGRDDSLSIRQDAFVYASILTMGQEIVHNLLPGRGAWIQMIRGGITLNDNMVLDAGDGVAITDEAKIQISNSGEDGTEFLLFDLG